MSDKRSLLAATAALMLACTLVRTANAGPPLICHPFVTGDATLLPWGAESGWRAPDPRYDRSHLVADLRALLTADAPVLARMENLRRATIYAAEDATLTAELLTEVLGRAAPAAGAEPSPLALFDAGYLVESYRQYAHAVGYGMLGAERREYSGAAVERLDGYALVLEAIARATGSRAEMEFAASLMVPAADGGAAHRARAAQGAAGGSLLARNLAD